MPDTSQGINLGDAVLEFLADTTKLDQGLDQIGPKVEIATARATTAFNGLDTAVDQTKENLSGLGASADSIEELNPPIDDVKVNLREARGEAMLLGEAFGVHLPRHVTSFIATLPGVGEALQSAFAATAVIFIGEAVAKLTEKVTDFVSTAFVYTKAMQDSDQAVKDYNKTLAASADELKKSKEAMDAFGANGSDALRLQIATLEKKIALTQQQEAEERSLISTTAQATQEYNKQTGFLAKGYDWIVSYVKGTKDQHDTLKALNVDAQEKYQLDARDLETQKAQLALMDEQLKVAHQLAEVENQKKVKSGALDVQKAQAMAMLSVDGETAAKRLLIDEHYADASYKLEVSTLNQKLAILKEHDANTKDEQTKLNAELTALEEKHNAETINRATKLKDELAEIVLSVRSLPAGRNLSSVLLGDDFNDKFAQARKAAQDLGITLKDDLAEAYKEAQKAAAALYAVDPNQADQKAATAAVLAAKKALDSYGVTERKTTEELIQGGLQLKKNKDDWQALSTAYGDAIAQAISAGTNIGAALKKATEAELEAIASKAMTQAIYYTGLGFAALAGFEEEAASNYFAAAAILGSIGVGAGVAAHAMGGGASGGSGGGGQNGIGNGSQPIQTSGGTSQGQVTTTNVQHFAAGGLVTQRTLAMVGDAPGGGDASEGILPLDNPDAMDRIASAISERMGGSGLQFNTHVRGGVIDAGTLKSVMRQMSKRIRQGTGLLTSSNTHRITRRSP
jgi:hypothetical protein